MIKELLTIIGTHIMDTYVKCMAYGLYNNERGEGYIFLKGWNDVDNLLLFRLNMRTMPRVKKLLYFN